MAGTRVVSKTDLVNQESIQFIRGQVLTLTLIEARPNTKMYVFFDGIDVTHKCNLIGNDIGTSIITDSLGQASIHFTVDGGIYNVGNKVITVCDVNDLSLLDTAGSVYGSSKATFRSNGVVKVFQTTETTITTKSRTIPVKLDPLAQSFFTYGVTGGMFLTSIEVYFQTRDISLPVRCEIRPMVNGYPAPLESINSHLVSILQPYSVNTSTDSSVPSKFIFNPPIYLKEDSDYCFVLRSNSNNYNVFTSKMGESSLEDGRKIFDNPYIGSIFKSENNVTWAAEQFEDIKFKINKAVFDTASKTVQFKANIPETGALGSQFSTVSGSNLITYRHDQEHGLEVGSKFTIFTRTDSLYTNASFNGIPYAQFNQTQTVTSIIDRNTLQFQVTNTATSTGTLTTASILCYVGVISEGINYSSSDTITFSAPTTGITATGTLNVINGKIKSVTITNAGTGYTSTPTITINTTTGTGASLYTSVLPTFSVSVNKPYQGFIPTINIENYGTSSTTNNISTTIGNYDGGNLVSYTAGKSFEFIDKKPLVNINQNSLIASSYNESALMSGMNSAKITITMNTDNPNVSPIINTNAPQYLNAYSYKINNQEGETITATASSGTIDTISLTSAGTGYSVDPTVVISAPDLVDGVQAIAHATRSGTAINAIIVDTHGSGYTSTPTITITRGTGDTTGAGGAGQAVMTPYNTELLPTGGNAKSKYITRRTMLQIISSGIRLYSVLSSVQGSSIDWYIRTSLSASGAVHEDLEWKRLSCDTVRNKSSYNGELFEYLFYLDNIDEFDTYDLKCVFTTDNPVNAPFVKSYRVIVVA